MKNTESNTKKQTTIRFLVVVCFVLVTIVAMLVYWFKPSQSPQQEPTQKKTLEKKSSIKQTKSKSMDSIAQEDNLNNLHNNKNSFTTGLEQLPKSLRGTAVDGEIIIDENKQLVVTFGLRRLFDYFLSALGEEPSSTIYARIEAYISSHTPEPASSQAIAIFHSYVQYLQATSKLEERFGNLQMRATKTGEFDSSLLKQRRSELINLRKQYFDAKTIRAFFSEEDGLEDYSLAMIEIEQDKNLSMEQKQQRKQDYMNALPDNADKQAMQKFTQQQADIAKLIEQTETLKKQGATAKQLYDMRVQLVGKEAADRLAIVDKEEADYEQRFLEYQRQKQAIIKQESDSNSNNKQATQQKIDKLEQSLFNEAERKRLAGYEAVYNSKNTPISTFMKPPLTPPSQGEDGLNLGKR